MDTLREVVIDEARWPRMFAKLQRAGMYSSCGCAGCGRCQDAARRLVRGVARIGQFSRSPELGADRATSRWAIGDRSIHLTRMGSGGSTIVDVDVERASAGASAEDDELTLKGVLTSVATHVKSDPGRQSARSALDIAIASASEHAGLKSRGLADIWSRKWEGPLSQVAMRNRSEGDFKDATSGLYLWLWRRGRYLGSTVNLRKRTFEHLKCFEEFNLSDRPSLRVYWLPLKKPASVRQSDEEWLKDIEERVLTAIAEAGARTSANRLGRAAQFARFGFTNKKVREL